MSSTLLDLFVFSFRVMIYSCWGIKVLSHPCAGVGWTNCLKCLLLKLLQTGSFTFYSRNILYVAQYVVCLFFLNGCL